MLETVCLEPFAFQNAEEYGRIVVTVGVVIFVKVIIVIDDIGKFGCLKTKTEVEDNDKPNMDFDIWNKRTGRRVRCVGTLSSDTVDVCLWFG